jgi:hypothetical protein
MGMLGFLLVVVGGIGFDDKRVTGVPNSGSSLPMTGMSRPNLLSYAYSM